VGKLSQLEGVLLIIEQGHLKGAFRGFRDTDSVFEFYNGGKWRQNEQKQSFYYAYGPFAKIIEEAGRYRLEVDGMTDSVEVVRDR
jgi:hypothetical protein